MAGTDAFLSELAAAHGLTCPDPDAPPRSRHRPPTATAPWLRAIS